MQLFNHPCPVEKGKDRNCIPLPKQISCQLYKLDFCWNEMEEGKWNRNSNYTISQVTFSIHVNNDD